MKADIIAELSRSIQGSDEVASLRHLADKFPGKVVFSSSFGLEDQVISHLIFSNNIGVDVFTLDTGRLFPETYAVWSRTQELYGKKIQAYYPKDDELQKFITEKGPNSFYELVENRKQCCHIRKVEPLKRALAGRQVWITGIRKDQSDARSEIKQIEWDDSNQIIKYHPLFNWSDEQLKKFISQNQVPVNPLHEKGYPSIGCQPCTRAVKPGEHPRSGRWWWESSDKKECGLHVK